MSPRLEATRWPHSRRTQRGRVVVRGAVALDWNAEEVGVELTIIVFVVVHGDRVGSGRESIEGAASDRAGDFYATADRALGRARKAFARLVEATRDGSVGVPQRANVRCDAGAAFG